MTKTKCVASSPNQGLHLRFALDNHLSTNDIVVSFVQRDEVIGRVRMDWSHWPLPAHFYPTNFSKVIDVLAELGRSRMNASDRPDE